MTALEGTEPGQKTTLVPYLRWPERVVRLAVAVALGMLVKQAEGWRLTFAVVVAVAFLLEPGVRLLTRPVSPPHTGRDRGGSGAGTLPQRETGRQA